MSILSSLSGGSTTTTPKVITSATYTALSTDGLIVSRPLVNAPVTVTLEVAPQAGRAHRIEDGKGIAATNPITVVPAAGTIAGQANVTIDQNYGAVTVEYSGTEWVVTAIYAPDTAHATTVPALTDIGSLQLTDLDTVNRSGQDYKATIAARQALFRQTPAGSRSPTLPAVLTSTDHDKNILLQGTSGALSVDGTVTTGFRCSVINAATGAATYSGIVGLLGTTTLASGSATTVLMVGSTVYATASTGTTTTTATAYTSIIASASGAVGSAVQITYTPTSGVWPTGEVITVSQTGGTGSFSSTTLSAPTNSSAPLTTNWTPSAAGTSTISSSTSPSMTNTTGTLSYAASAAAANTYSMSQSASVGLVGVAVTLSFAPAGGSWPGSTTLTPAVTGVAGAFSPTTLSPTGTATVTCTFTPSAAGTATFSVTNNQSLANPPNLAYTATVVATAYTQALSSSTGGVGSSVNFTLTPTSGGWPTGTTLTPSVSPGTGTLSPSSASPAAGSTAPVVFAYTPIQAGSFNLNSSATPTMTNSTGAVSYVVAASIATAYTVTLSAASGSVGNPVNVIFAPSPSNSVWPANETITPSASPSTGTSFSFGGFQPTAGTTTPLVGTFTPSNPGTYSITSSASPAMSTGSASYSATGTAPAYPTVTSGTLQAILDANAGVAVSSGLVTTLLDQSGGGHDLSATAGVSVGPNVNGFPSIAFSGSSFAACSGLRTSAAWLSNLTTGSTVVLAFKTSSTVPGIGAVLNMEPSALNYSNDYIVTFEGGLKWYWRPSVNAITLLPAASLAANTVYKIILRIDTGASTAAYWINGGGKNSQTISPATLGSADFAIGQAASSSAASKYSLSALTGALFLEAHLFQGALTDSDVATYQTYLTNKWGS